MGGRWYSGRRPWARSDCRQGRENEGMEIMLLARSRDTRGAQKHENHALRPAGPWWRIIRMMSARHGPSGGSRNPPALEPRARPCHPGGMSILKSFSDEVA